MRSIIRLTMILLACQFGLSNLTNGQEWSSFQNGGKPVSIDVNIPTQWKPDSGIEWELDLPGYGQSSPVVFEDLVYVTSVTGDNKETLNIQAINIADGKQAWIFNRLNTSPEKNTVMVSRAAPTPVADKNGVIAFFEGGNLVALDHAGKMRWERDLKEEFGKLGARHGLASSLEQTEEHVFVWCERMEDPFVLGINKSDGSTVWKVPGLGSTSWGSPRLIELEGETHLVLSAMGLVVGMDPQTGDRLWEFSQLAGNSSSTPMDLGDGKILLGAMGSRSGGPAEPSNGVIEVKKTEQGYEADWVWTAPKATCSFGSPIAHEGRAYFVNRTGIVHCHSIATGEPLFVDRLPSGSIWATPLVSKNGIYFFGKDGVTTILKPSDKLEIASDNSILEEDSQKPAAASGPGASFSGTVLYAAAVAKDKLLIRFGEKLFAVTKE